VFGVQSRASRTAVSGPVGRLGNTKSGADGETAGEAAFDAAGAEGEAVTEAPGGADGR